MKEKMEIKDLISVGIFGAIYLAIFMISITVVGMVPKIYFFAGAVSSLFLGTIYMLFVSRTGKKYSILMMGVLIVTIMGLMMGGLWTVFVFGYGVVIIAEIIASIGNYKSFKLNTLSYMVFALFPFGVYSAFWVMKDQMLEMSKPYGDIYVTTLEKLINPTTLIYAIIATLICAMIGSLIGKKILKKHFEKAGIA